ncbi:TolC family protein [Dyadobacter sp. CY261]|uniref:TolC family protein n=1 Tax=Dyadobacter sp. CY261 TaxID=2907203 RepID=UPI001F20F1E7|nr:TolC family protein [Dyadobacter sp. CY261]MCF0069646.1 TolC family protein [Dyadobacter sp. CY261]
MKNRTIIKSLGVLATVLLLNPGKINAQQAPLTLDQTIEKALQNNKMYSVKSSQVEEKQAKVKEDQIKAYPAVSVNSTYQYNASIGHLSIPQGALGQLPLPEGNAAMPDNDLNFDLGEHHTFNAGATIYQPISQLSKIKTGVAISKTDVEIADREKVKVSLEIRQAVEKLYYGILILGKQKEEAVAKLELARIKFYDVESGKLSGKTIESNESGLQANIADKEQKLLKLEIRQDDYLADLSRLTGIETGEINLSNAALPPTEVTKTLEDYRTGAMENNVDIQLADLGKIKSELAIKAAKLSYRPDIGVFAGYTYQKGNVILPRNNPIAGASLKWDVQSIFSNKEVIKQRYLVSQQAQTLLADKKDEVNDNVDKAYRKIRQAQSLIQVAQRAYTFRMQELKEQEDKKLAGMNTQTDLLDTKSSLAKSEADLLAAQLNYRLAVSDLKILTERY